MTLPEAKLKPRKNHTDYLSLSYSVNQIALKTTFRLKKHQNELKSIFCISVCTLSILIQLLRLKLPRKEFFNPFCCNYLCRKGKKSSYLTLKTYNQVRNALGANGEELYMPKDDRWDT